MGVLNVDYEPDLFGELMRPEELHTLESRCCGLCMGSDMERFISIGCSFFYEEETYGGTVLNWVNINIKLDANEVGLPCWMVLDNDVMFNLAKRKILKIIHECPCYIAVTGYPIPTHEYHPTFMDPRPDHPYEEMYFPYYSRTQKLN